MTTEAGSSAEPDPPSLPAHSDFSAIQGFQIVAADPGVAGQDKGWREALKLELETRATRFHHAVDSAIVLSNDGLVRWLGDPVARLAPGRSALDPGAVVLADDALPPAAQDLVRTRVELWLAATVKRLLGPLLALESLTEGSQVVRDLAGKLARSFGILDREPMRAEMRALGQNDRAELRKHGVRFGAYYVFTPALIKPAARTLALQLWSLHAPGDAGALAATLAQIASSGRTSLAYDKAISPDGFRVAGYRPCGERLVRVDVLERLGGIIRAAIVEAQARAALAPAGHGRSIGFLVTGQMTSLTGCAGEPFASILRAMGFRSVEMKKSQFIGSSPPRVEPTTKIEPSSVGEVIDPASEDSSADRIEAEGETVDVSCAEVPAGLAALDGAEEADISREVETEGIPAAVAFTDKAELQSGTESTETAAANEDLDENIVVWRPARNARSRPAPNSGRHEGIRLASQESGRAGGAEDSRRDLAGSDGRESKRDGREPVRANEKHRQRRSGRDMPPAHSPSEPERMSRVDPNSPFAKLLELRSRLEEQANKRS